MGDIPIKRGRYTEQHVCVIPTFCGRYTDNLVCDIPYPTVSPVSGLWAIYRIEATIYESELPKIQMAGLSPG